jgi:hypothetical protein
VFVPYICGYEYPSLHVLTLTALGIDIDRRLQSQWCIERKVKSEKMGSEPQGWSDDSAPVELRP